MDMDRIPVRLLKHHGVFNPGEIAGFVPEIAANLIEQGYAEAYDPEASVDDTAASGATEASAAKPSNGKAAADPLPAQGSGQGGAA